MCPLSAPGSLREGKLNMPLRKTRGSECVSGEGKNFLSDLFNCMPPHIMSCISGVLLQITFWIFKRYTSHCPGVAHLGGYPEVGEVGQGGQVQNPPTKFSTLISVFRFLQKMDRFSQYSAVILSLLMVSFFLLAHWLACLW